MSNNIRILNLDPQEITINGAGTPTGITNVYVNGVDVTVGTKAYVIVPTKLSELTNDEGFITNAEETDPTVPSYVKNITQANINSWNDKQDQLVSTQNIKSINGNSILGSGNLTITNEYEAGTGIDITGNIISNTITSYNDLTDTPIIPTKTSDLVNDSGYITNSVDDLQNYLSTLDLDKILPKSSDSGTNLYLEDSAEMKLDIKLKAHEMVQHTTTGKNMLNPIGASDSNNGIDFTNNGDGTFTANGTASANTNFPLTILTDTPITLEANESYTQSLNIVSGTFGGSIVPAFKNGGGTISYNYFNSTSVSPNSTKTPTEEMYAHSYNFYISSGTTITNCTFKVQLEKGSTATTYEEYTGGYASPNPDYPQDIHVTTGENTITMCGINLFDKSTVQTGKIVNRNDGDLSNNASYSASDYIPVKAGISYYQSNCNSYYSVYYDKDKLYLGICGTNSFTPSQDGYIRTTIPNTNLDTAQIEKGNSASSYQSYESTVYPIELGDIELCKFTGGIVPEDFEDRIFKNVPSDPDYVSGAPLNSIRYDKKVVKFIPTEDMTWTDEGEFAGTHRFSTPLSWTSSISNAYVSNYFGSDDIPNQKNYISLYGGKITFAIDNNFGITTVSDWTDWLSNHTDIVVYYADHSYYMETELRVIDPDLSAQFNNILNDSTAYDGGTNISQENDDLPFDIEASTYKKIS